MEDEIWDELSNIGDQEETLTCTLILTPFKVRGALKASMIFLRPGLTGYL